MMGGVPEYATITLEPTSIELNNTYPAAAIRGRQDIEIRPNVSGFITKLCVDEGATVKKAKRCSSSTRYNSRRPSKWPKQT